MIARIEIGMKTYGQMVLRPNNNIISSRNMAELEGKSRLIFIYYIFYIISQFMVLISDGNSEIGAHV